MSDAADPIPMVLHCPKCGLQHIDASDEAKGWDNPPHKSHLCHGCGCIWRPADVPTMGMREIATMGLSDNWGPGRETLRVVAMEQSQVAERLIAAADREDPDQGEGVGDVLHELRRVNARTLDLLIPCRRRPS